MQLNDIKKVSMPKRFAYGDKEYESIQEVIEYYKNKEEDLEYEGYFEKKFCKEFSSYMQGGFSDAVATGTASVYIALAALDLPKGSDVLISPVTDSGPLNCIILQGFNPIVIDSKVDSFNIDYEQFKNSITSNTKALLLVHTGGEPVEDIEKIVNYAKKHNIKVLEDCSQATGAEVNGNKIGTFGNIAAFSTMYRKNLIAGSSGGIVFTKDEELFHQALAHADRGKQVWRTDLNLNDPSSSLFPALNFNTDEISCAIGSASLSRLDETIEQRRIFLREFIPLLKEKSKVCKPSHFSEASSPFFFPVFVDENKINCSKIEFAKALASLGVGNNVHYGCVISEWEWAKSYYKQENKVINAINMKNSSFNLFLNEKYSSKEAVEIVDTIVELEKVFKL